MGAKPVWWLADGLAYFVGSGTDVSVGVGGNSVFVGNGNGVLVCGTGVLEAVGSGVKDGSRLKDGSGVTVAG